jgi:hypothetical protein
MIINNKIISDIKKYSNSNLDSESCGFIVESDHSLLFLPVENKHPDKKNYFLVSPLDYLKIKNKYKILYFFHSHFSNSSFSDLDVFHQKYHNMNMLLYNLDTDEMLEMKCK